MRYLVTGGAGFIGSNTVDELVRRGHSVTVLDDLSAGKEANLEKVREQITFIRGTITDRETVEKACHGADYVLHLAARTSVPRSVKQPLETNQINVDGTLNVLVAARDASVRRIVFASSSSIYGDTPTLPKHEGMPPAPISPYGVSKLVGELYGRVFHRTYGLDFVALRYFNVFGPRQDPGSPYSGVLSLFITAMRNGGQPNVFGDGEQSRDFTFVQNVVAANLQALRDPGHWRPGVQSRNRGAVHAELHLAVAGGIRGETGEGEPWSAARRRYPRFASGHFTGCPKLCL